MVNYKEILRLSHEGYSQRQLESSLHCSRHTIREVLTAAKANGITYPLDDSFSNEQLEAILFPNRYASDNAYLAPDFAYIHKELAKPKVTLTLLWDEYRQKAETLGKCPYMPTRVRRRQSRRTSTVPGHAQRRRQCVSTTSPETPWRSTGRVRHYRSTTR